MVWPTLGSRAAKEQEQEQNKKSYSWNITWNSNLQTQLGLPGLPYFTADPVFQPRSPTSRKEAARETESPVFDYRLIQTGRMAAFDYLYILILIMIHCFGFQM